MKYLHTATILTVCLFVVVLGLQAENKYVGAKACGMCHKAEKQGNQLGIWQKSKHAEAFKTLTTEKANAIAKERGLKMPAAESPECLECHVIGYGADEKTADKNFDYKDGVQCETCHGAGSAYKTITVMKDKSKAVAAGMTDFKNEKEIEKFCRKCHNEKSPQYKTFKFEEMWPKIKHARPKT